MYTKQERHAQIIEMLYKFHFTSWWPSSHQVAIGLGLKPSHHVRGMLADLEKCGLIGVSIRTVANGKPVHRWFLQIAAIEESRPDWKDYLMEKFGVWPMSLL